MRYYYSVSTVSFPSPPRGHVDGVPPSVRVKWHRDRAKNLIRLIATDFCRGEIEVAVTKRPPRRRRRRRFTPSATAEEKLKATSDRGDAIDR